MVIQARDASGANRVCGMDEFSLSLKSITYKKDKEIEEPIEDFPGEFAIQFWYYLFILINEYEKIRRL